MAVEPTLLGCFPQKGVFNKAFHKQRKKYGSVYHGVVNNPATLGRRVLPRFEPKVPLPIVARKVLSNDDAIQSETTNVLAHVPDRREEEAA